MRCTTVAALLALLAAVAPWPVAVGPVLANHGGKHVECPTPTLEGISGQVQVPWTRHPSDCATSVMHHGDHTARHDECVGLAGNASHWCEACHHSDSSTDGLTTNNQVQHTDCDADGIGIGVHNLQLNGGGIHAGNDAGLSHAAVAANGG